jgi:hypothetical protein
MRKLLIGFVFVVSVSVAAYFLFHRPKPPLEEAYAGNREVTLWSTAAQVRSPLATLAFGDRLGVMGHYGDQVQVRAQSGVIGWVNQQDLLSAELWKKAKDLDVSTATLPVEARGHTRVLSNIHLDPGRDAPRLRQLSKDIPLDLFERRVAAVPLTTPKSPDQAGSTADSAGAKKEEWWLVRAHMPDQTFAGGWILGRFIDLDVPAPLPDYASATGMRIVAWFELNRVPDSTGGAKPQYLVLGDRGAEGQLCDFSQMRVFTWGRERERYETAFIESDVCGQLPLKLTQATIPGGDVSFAFADVSSGDPEQRLYRMHQTMVRRVREDGAAPAKHRTRKKDRR